MYYSIMGFNRITESVDINATHLSRMALVVCGATLYTIIQFAQRKQAGESQLKRYVVFDFFSATFTGVICGLGAVGLSPEIGVSLALYGAGSLLGPRGFDKILTVVARK